MEKLINQALQASSESAEIDFKQTFTPQTKEVGLKLSKTLWLWQIVEGE